MEEEEVEEDQEFLPAVIGEASTTRCRGESLTSVCLCV